MLETGNVKRMHMSLQFPEDHTELLNPVSGHIMH